jgi:hypothetical protein
MTNDLYDEWIRNLFDRPDTEREWYRDSDIDIEASKEQKVMLIDETLLRCGVDLARFTDRQVRNGLNYIFNNSISDTVYLLCQTGVTEELRINAVRQMKHLYRDCFANRCSSSLCHLSESSSPLNGCCYMLWDVSPLTSWKSIVLEVMEDALYAGLFNALYSSSNRSGLRGLRVRRRSDPVRWCRID